MIGNIEDLSKVVSGLCSNLTTINVFIEEAEKEIFNPDEISQMDSQTLITLYDSAAKRQLFVIDLARKVMIAFQRGDYDMDSEKVGELAQRVREAVVNINLSIPSKPDPS